MKRKSMILGAFLICPALPVLAQASDATVSWSYFDIGVLRVAPDHRGLDDGIGPAIRGSGAIDENWHVFLGWSRTPLEGAGEVTGPGGTAVAFTVDDDVDRFHIGIGYNLTIAASTDLFARAAWERAGSADFAAVPGGATPAPAVAVKAERSDGYSVEVGVRSAFGPRFEAGVSARYTSLDELRARLGDESLPVPGVVGDSATSVLLYGQFKFGNGWGVLAEGDFNSEYSAVFVGARLSY